MCCFCDSNLILLVHAVPTAARRCHCLSLCLFYFEVLSSCLFLLFISSLCLFSHPSHSSPVLYHLLGILVPVFPFLFASSPFLLCSCVPVSFCPIFPCVLFKCFRYLDFLFCLVCICCCILGFWIWIFSLRFSKVVFFHSNYLLTAGLWSGPPCLTATISSVLNNTFSNIQLSELFSANSFSNDWSWWAHISSKLHTH